ncbi:hypothetical protein BFJ71_g16732 [Fusarium oxysporum]|nr:hypothetical protein BFJ71_g16732 [Fusarium oxysporum]
MMLWSYSYLRTLLLLALFLLRDTLAQDVYDFDTCKADIERILNGTLSIGDINNTTIDQYIWDGIVQGIDKHFPRDQYLALTYDGCIAICGDKVALNDAPKALGIAATWIFPLAILFSLPFDSLHRSHARRTLEAVSNWLGSPQTALTATIFNFRQIRECHRRVKEANDIQSVWRDALFVLSCFNQFDLLGASASPVVTVNVFIYGLFRPLSLGDNDDDTILLRDLLKAIAHQLRMLRRRGVIPTLLSLGTFLVAFVFSVALAFGDLGDNTTAHSLALGLLFSWLPLLVIFTIVDRNPISAVRSAELMERWLYNVSKIRQWKLTRGAEIEWWSSEIAGERPFLVGDFVGQGRRLRYCGLTSAVLEVSKEHMGRFDTTIASFDDCGRDVCGKLEDGKPASWYVISFSSLLLVWTEVMMAFMVSFNTPTVGLGCRSLSYLLVAIFSSVSWFINFWKRPPTPACVISHIANAIVIVLLVAIIGFQLTGGMSNCYCKASMLNVPYLSGYGGYVDFENAQFYKENFNVQTYWAIGTTFGGLIPLIAFVVVTFRWKMCAGLWSANERTQGYQFQPVHANMDWLR